MKARGICVDLEGISGLPAADLGANMGGRALGLGAAGVYGDHQCLPLVVDGQVVCKLRKSEFSYWFEQLRQAKVCAMEGFKTHWEVVGFDAAR